MLTKLDFLRTKPQKSNKTKTAFWNIRIFIISTASHLPYEQIFSFESFVGVKHYIDDMKCWVNLRSAIFPPNLSPVYPE